MASLSRVSPDWRTLRPTTLGECAEVRVLRVLDEGLPPGFTILHGVDWSAGDGADERHGEVDVVVIGPAADIVLIEVKSGHVDTSSDTFLKRYGQNRRDVLAQVRGQFGAIRNRLHKAGIRTALHHLLVFTDMAVASETVQWPRERIVDGDEVDGLAAKVRAQLQGLAPDEATHRRAVAFFENVFRIVPDVSALAGRAQALSTRLADGLATWVPRLQTPSGLIRVQGTAGSGKTQLALRLLREANERGQRAAYVCFNRPLADHIARLVPVRIRAETFHELCARVCRGQGQAVDFGRPDVFDTSTRFALEHLAAAPADLDLVVIDEVQDLQPAWVEGLLGRLRPDGTGVLLEDPEQQLYGDRVPFELPDAVTVTCPENFRSPRALVRMINMLGLTAQPVVARGPVEGSVPDPLVYGGQEGQGGQEEAEDLLAKTRTAVERLVAQGFAPRDIAVLTLRGRERSVVLAQERIGDLQLRRFTGRYDDGGGAIRTDGQLLAETVRRFKGQSAPAVVLTECDLGELDEVSRRLLFVGLTRASLSLEWVMSRRTEACLARALEAEG
jgi:hypothetical protein